MKKTTINIIEGDKIMSNREMMLLFLEEIQPDPNDPDDIERHQKLKTAIMHSSEKVIHAIAERFMREFENRQKENGNDNN